MLNGEDWSRMRELGEREGWYTGCNERSGSQNCRLRQKLSNNFPSKTTTLAAQQKYGIRPTVYKELQPMRESVMGCRSNLLLPLLLPMLLPLLLLRSLSRSSGDSVAIAASFVTAAVFAATAATTASAIILCSCCCRPQPTPPPPSQRFRCRYF